MDLCKTYKTMRYLRVAALALALVCSAVADSSCLPTEPVDCSLQPLDHPTLHRHDTSCALFYRCEDGWRETFSCELGLRFNPDTEACDLSDNVECQLCDGSPLALCPPVEPCLPGELGVRKPYPSNCTYYLYCDVDKPQLRRCPAGQEFSPSIRRCTTPELAMCPVCSMFTTPAPTIPGFCPPQQSCAGRPVGTQLPIVTSCSTYIYCDAGEVERIRNCPPGDEFSPSLSRCMLAEQAGCPKCEVTTTTISTTELSTANPCLMPTCSLSEFGVSKPHPFNCSLYIYCNIDGQARIRYCPNGTHFSEEHKRCMAPTEANCVVCEITSTTVITTELTTVDPCPMPTCSLSEFGVTKPHPLNCSLYIYCNLLGEVGVRYCPNGTHYSEANRRCMAPAEANCVVCEITTTTILTTISTTELPIDPTEPECPLPTCGPNETFHNLAYPSNCSLYIYCDGTEDGSVSFCPGELEFSSTLNRCVEPDIANCTPCIITTVSTTLEITTTTEAPTTEPLTPRPCIREECTAEDLYYTKAYAENCTLYVYCDGTAEGQVRFCPAGLEYSLTLRRCVVPELAQCIPCETTSTTELTTTPSPTTVDVCEIPTCNEEDLYFSKPYPLNCSLYIYCSGSVDGDIRFCPVNMMFSATLGRCTSPEIAQCTPCELTTTESTTLTSTPAPTEDLCPPTTCGVDELYWQKPHALDCGMYVYCNGDPYGENRFCPDGLEFSATLMHCTTPEIAQCTPCGITTTTLDPCPLPVCETKFETLPYPTDCGMYIYCDENLVGEPRYCMEGEHFFAAEGWCTDPETANCLECGVTTEPPTTVDPCPLPTCSVAFENLIYPMDCGKYIYCHANLTEEVRSCMIGDHFSEDLGHCTDPATANCLECGVTTEPPTTVDPCPLPTCSVAFENLIYPMDCGKYIYCHANLTGEVRSCMTGDHFSEELGHCVDADIANCVECGATTEPPTTVDPCPLPTCTIPFQNLPDPMDCGRYYYCHENLTLEMRYCMDGDHFSVDLEFCTDPASANCLECGATTEPPTTVDPCPLPTCTIPFQNLPDPMDCGRYYYCHENLTQEMRYCMDGDHFSADLEFCTDPATANCLECGATTQPPTTVDPCPLPTCTIPYENLPDPMDCGRYYYCHENLTQEMRYCMEGDHFSVDLEYCTDPATANCLECGATTEPPTTVDPCPLPTCSVAFENLIYPTDCGKYIYCHANLTGEVRSCIIGDHFSEELGYCVEANIANCVECGATTEPPTTVDPCPLPTCMKAYENLKYPTDCGRYIYCTEDLTAEVRLCIAGQHFSEELGRCVAPEIAKCVECGAFTSTTPTEELCPLPICEVQYSNLPNPNNCGMYIYCTEELVGEDRYCIPGMHFNTDLGYCTDPETAECLPCGVTTTTMNPCPMPVCETLYSNLPHPTDCGKYFYCDDNLIGDERYCYQGLHFSPSEGICVAPELAECVLCGQTTVTETTVTTLPPTTSTTTTQPPTTTTTTTTQPPTTTTTTTTQPPTTTTTTTSQSPTTTTTTIIPTTSTTTSLRPTTVTYPAEPDPLRQQKRQRFFL